MGAQRVIDSWGSAGLRHAGAQYVVDRDGTIFQAVDPDLATVHVNVFKTLPGINNDNSIGIEMCHAGHQNYPREQRDAVIKLVAYLQERYKVQDANIVTHRYAQRGDHTDPVNFDFDEFLAEKDHFRNQAIAYKVNHVQEDSAKWNVPAVEETVTTTTTTTTTTPAQIVVPSQSPIRAITPHPAPPPVSRQNPNRADLRGPIEMDPALLENLSGDKSHYDNSSVAPIVVPTNPQRPSVPPPVMMPVAPTPNATPIPQSTDIRTPVQPTIIRSAFPAAQPTLVPAPAPTIMQPVPIMSVPARPVPAPAVRRTAPAPMPGTTDQSDQLNMFIR